MRINWAKLLRETVIVGQIRFGSCKNSSTTEIPRGYKEYLFSKVEALDGVSR